MPDDTKFEMTELYKGKVKIKFYPISHQYWISVNDLPFKRKTGVTTFIGIKDKSRPLGIWQSELTADFLLTCIENKVKIDEDKAIEAVIQSELAKDQAADIGTEIHDWIEKYIRNKLKQPGFENLPDMPKLSEAITGTNSFFEWEKKAKVKYVSTETPVYSLEYDYPGIEDITLLADDKFCDADFKSSNGLYNGVRAQTAAYAMARMEAGGKKSQGRWAIRLSKYSEAEYIRREERKKQIKRIIARVKGVPFKDYEPKTYQVFEAKFLDNEKSFMQRDFEAFLNCKALHKWNNDTDPFYQDDNW